MNINICKNCKYINQIIYHKYIKDNHIIEETNCFRDYLDISNINQNNLICEYHYYNHIWIKYYIKNNIYDLTKNQLDDKLNLNNEVNFNCPFKLEHQLFDWNNKK